MDHDTMKTLIEVTEAGYRADVLDALAVVEQATGQLNAAVLRAYDAAVPSHVVAGWLGMSRSSYYRYLRDLQDPGGEWGAEPRSTGD